MNQATTRVPKLTNAIAIISRLLRLKLGTLGPSMSEVYGESRLQSVAQRWYVGGAVVAQRLRLGTIPDHVLRVLEGNPGAAGRPGCGDELIRTAEVRPTLPAAIRID